MFNIRAAGFYVLIPSYSSSFDFATSIWPKMGVCPDHPFYPLVNYQFAIENHHVEWENSL